VIALDISSIGPPHVKHVGNRDILADVVAGVMRNALDEPGLVRRGLLRQIWTDLKCFGASGVRNIEPSRIRGIESVVIDGPVARHGPLIVAALSKVLECERIFEFGTYRGETAWLLAHNLPIADVFTLDLGSAEAAARAKLELTDPEYFVSWDRGSRFRGTPEASRITQLLGDSATYDFSPYSGRIDLAYIDASHSYSYVRSDTEAAFGMLSQLGTIVWDDYTHYSGVYAYLNELAPSLDAPIYHVQGTQLALYSRWPVIVGDD
jgi:hypothetical protein